jgi:hypothetical protein
MRSLAAVMRAEKQVAKQLDIDAKDSDAAVKDTAKQLGTASPAPGAHPARHRSPGAESVRTHMPNRVTVELGAGTRSANESSWLRRIELVVQSLQARLGTSVEPDLIRAEVEAGFAAYSQARIREFVPVLVESRVRSRLVRISLK